MCVRVCVRACVRACVKIILYVCLFQSDTEVARQQLLLQKVLNADTTGAGSEDIDPDSGGYKIHTVVYTIDRSRKPPTGHRRRHAPVRRRRPVRRHHRRLPPRVFRPSVPVNVRHLRPVQQNILSPRPLRILTDGVARRLLPMPTNYASGGRTRLGVLRRVAVTRKQPIRNVAALTAAGGRPFGSSAAATTTGRGSFGSPASAVTTGRRPFGSPYSAITTDRRPFGSPAAAMTTGRRSFGSPASAVTTGRRPFGSPYSAITTDRRPFGSPAAAMTTGRRPFGSPVAAMTTGRRPFGSPYFAITTGRRPFSSSASGLATGTQPFGFPVAAMTTGRRPIGSPAAAMTTGRRLFGSPVAAMTTGRRPFGSPVAAMTTGRRPSGSPVAAMTTGRRPFSSMATNRRQFRSPDTSVIADRFDGHFHTTGMDDVGVNGYYPQGVINTNKFVGDNYGGSNTGTRQQAMEPDVLQKIFPDRGGPISEPARQVPGNNRFQSDNDVPVAYQNSQHRPFRNLLQNNNNRISSTAYGNNAENPVFISSPFLVGHDARSRPQTRQTPIVDGANRFTLPDQRLAENTLTYNSQFSNQVAIDQRLTDRAPMLTIPNGVMHQTRSNTDPIYQRQMDRRFGAADNSDQRQYASDMNNNQGENRNDRMTFASPDRIENPLPFSGPSDHLGFLASNPSDALLPPEQGFGSSRRKEATTEMGDNDITGWPYQQLTIDARFDDLPQKPDDGFDYDNQNGNERSSYAAQRDSSDFGDVRPGSTVNDNRFQGNVAPQF